METEIIMTVVVDNCIYTQLIICGFLYSDNNNINLFWVFYENLYDWEVKYKEKDDFDEKCKNTGDNIVIMINMLINVTYIDKKKFWIV